MRIQSWSQLWCLMPGLTQSNDRSDIIVHLILFQLSNNSKESEILILSFNLQLIILIIIVYYCSCVFPIKRWKKERNLPIGHHQLPLNWYIFQTHFSFIQHFYLQSKVIWLIICDFSIIFAHLNYLMPCDCIFNDTPLLSLIIPSISLCTQHIPFQYILRVTVILHHIHDVVTSHNLTLACNTLLLLWCCCDRPINV